MKIGTLTFEQAVKKLYQASAIMADQLGELVSINRDKEILNVYPQSGEDEYYQFCESHNETVDVFVATNGNFRFQYMRLFTEDGDEMDFIVYEPAPIITLDSVLHPQ